jgi:t-SNARE complex subunit (syntaxin)
MAKRPKTYMDYYLNVMKKAVTRITVVMIITIIILVFLILFLIRTVFQVFEANNKVISLFALVPIDEIQNL